MGLPRLAQAACTVLLSQAGHLADQPKIGAVRQQPCQAQGIREALRKVDVELATLDAVEHGCGCVLRRHQSRHGEIIVSRQGRGDETGIDLVHTDAARMQVQVQLLGLI